MPLGDAWAAARAPAVVSASARAAIAAVRFPLHREGDGGATAAPTGAYGASCGTLSCTSDRSVAAPNCGGRAIGTVLVNLGGGTVNPGGGDPGGWAVTLAGSSVRL